MKGGGGLEDVPINQDDIKPTLQSIELPIIVWE